MESSALEQAIADGLIVSAPTPPPDLSRLQGFELVDRMADWLDANTLVRDPFPVPLIEAILGEAFPNATRTAIRVAADSIDQRWLNRGERTRRPDDSHLEIGEPVDNYSAVDLPAPERREKAESPGPARSSGKPAGLGVALMLVPLLCLALLWALT